MAAISAAEQIHIQMPWQDLVLRLRMRGSGPPVLLVHGWNHSSEIWRDVMALLSASNQVIALDLPGFGQSPPLPPHHVTIGAYAAILHGVIQTVADEQQPLTIAADSLGGIITLELLEKKPIPCEYAVFSGCPIDGLPLTSAPLQAPGVVSGVLQTLRETPPDLAASLVKIASLVTVRDIQHIDPAIVRAALNADPPTAEALLHELSRPRRDQAILHVRQQHPATHFTVLRGKHDRIVSARTAQRLATLLNAPLVEIEKAAHTPMLENVDGYMRGIQVEN